MTRNRSRDAETEDVNQRRLQRGAVKRQHISSWAVGRDELAPGVVGDIHLNPSVVEIIREVGGGSGVGQLLVLSATGDSFASGGDYVTADTIVYQHGFDQVTAAGSSIVWPTDAVGEIQVEFAWDTYQGGGTIEIEVDGVVPAWGTVATGSSGSEGCKRRGVHIAEGAVVKVKVTQSSGSAKTADVLLEFSIPDPSLSVALSYEEVVMADGPIAYWRLDEATGTSAADHTGNGHTGTYTGSYSLLAAGVMDDGSTNAAMAVPGGAAAGMAGVDWSDLEFANLLPFSVECWFKPNALPAGSTILVQKQVAGSGAGWEMVCVGGASAHVVANRGSGGGSEVESAAGSIVVGSEHYAAATFDGTTMSLYLDGTLVATDATGTGNMGTNSVALSIGYDSDGTPVTFDGTIDEVAVYDRALSSAEVAEHYAVGSSG